MDDRRVKILLPLMLLATSSAPPEEERSYLVSVVGFPLGQDESLARFSFSTWGVWFKAVCRIPGGWRVKAGGSAAPDGVLEAEGSHGATWLRERDPTALRDLVLVTMVGPVQREDIRDGSGVVPASFSGTATISTLDGEREAALDYRNIVLRPAERCPAP